MVTHSISPFPIPLTGMPFSVPNFEKRGRIRKRKKNEYLGELKEFLRQIFALREGGAYYVFVEKRLSKIKYKCEGSVLNVDLGSF